MAVDEPLAPCDAPRLVGLGRRCSAEAPGGRCGETLDVEPLSSSSVGSVVMSAVRSTARSSPPSADERLATGGPSRRRGAGGEDRANAPFSGTSNARGSREAVSIRMARGWVRASNESPTRDRARHAPPVVPTRRLGVRHADKDTNALLMTDTAGYRRAPPARRASVRRDRGDASARHGDATASCEAMRVRARALVPASPCARGLGHPRGV